MVVSVGEVILDSWESSKPHSQTSFGTQMPSSLNMSSMSMATKSFAQIKTSGRESRLCIRSLRYFRYSFGEGYSEVPILPVMQYSSRQESPHRYMAFRYPKKRSKNDWQCMQFPIYPILFLPRLTISWTKTWILDWLSILSTSAFKGSPRPHAGESTKRRGVPSPQSMEQYFWSNISTQMMPAVFSML